MPMANYVNFKGWDNCWNVEELIVWCYANHMKKIQCHPKNETKKKEQKFSINKPKEKGKT